MLVLPGRQPSFQSDSLYAMSFLNRYDQSKNMTEAVGAAVSSTSARDEKPPPLLYMINRLRSLADDDPSPKGGYSSEYADDHERFIEYVEMKPAFGRVVAIADDDDALDEGIDDVFADITCAFKPDSNPMKVVIDTVCILWRKLRVKQNVVGATMSVMRRLVALIHHPLVKRMQKMLIDFWEDACHERLAGLSVGEFEKHLRGMAGNWSSLIHSEVSRSITQLFTCLVAIGCIPADWLHVSYANMKLFSASILKEQVCASDFVSALLSTFYSLSGVARRCKEGMTFTKAIGMSSELDDLRDRFTDLSAREASIRIGAESASGVTPNEFLYDVEKLKNDLIRHLALCPMYEKKEVQGMVASAKDMWVRVNDSRTHAHLRVAPFCFLLEGESGIGKSTIAQMLMKTALEANGQPATADYLYTMDLHDEFWSGYKNHITGVYMDDIANEKLAEGQINRVLRLCNNVPCPCNMASLDEKGKIFAEPRVVCGTTNVVNIDADVYSNKPSAILRRFHLHITARVRRSFAKKGQTCLDPEKYGSAILADAWEFDVFTVMLDGKNPGSKRKMHPNHSVTQPKDTYWHFQYLKFEGRDCRRIGINKLRRIVTDMSARHFRIQETLVKHSYDLDKYTFLCPSCKDFSERITGTPCSCEHHSDREEPQIIPHACDEERRRIEERIQHVILTGQDVWDELVMEALSGFTADISALSLLAIQHLRSYIKEKGLTELITYVPWWLMDTPFGWYMIAKYKHGETLVVLDQLAVYFVVFLLVFSSTFVGCDVSALMALWYSLQDKQHCTHLYVTYLKCKGIVSRHEEECIFSFKLVFFVVASCVYLCVSSSFWMYMYARILGLCLLFYHLKEPQYAKSLRLLASQLRDGKRQSGTWFDLLSAPLAVTGVAVSCSTILKPNMSNIRNTFRRKLNIVPQARIGEDTELTPKTQEMVDRRDNLDERDSKWWDNLRGYRDRTDLITATSSMDRDQMVRVVMKNVFHAQAKSRHCITVGIRSGYVLFPYHAIPKESVEWTFTRKVSDGLCGNATFKAIIGREDVYKIPDHDLCIAFVPQTGTIKDFVAYLPTDFPQTSRSGRVLTRDHLGFEHRIGFAGAVFGTYKNNNAGDNSAFTGVRSHMQSSVGLCAAPLVVDDARSFVLGFHIGGDAALHVGLASTITKAQMENYLAECVTVSTTILPHAGVIPDTVMGTRAIEESSPARSALEKLEPKERMFNFLGSYHKTVTPSSNVMRTFCDAEIREIFDIDTEWDAPSGFRPKWKGMSVALEKYTVPSIGFAQHEVERAVEDYLAPLKEVMRSELWRDKIRMLSMHEALNGIDGLRFVDAMAFSTSVGFPLSGPKSNLCPLEEDGKRSLAPILEQEYARLEKVFRSGSKAYCAFTSTYKDEPTPTHKEKVRVFQSCGMVLQLFMRRHFLMLCRFLSMNPFLSECAVGINPLGREWHELYDFVSQFGESRTMALDYKAYDQTMSSQLTVAAFGVFISLAKVAGFTENDIKMMHTLSGEICLPTIIADCAVLELFGSNPSGHSLTVYLNSVVNSLYHRIVFFRKYPEATSFRQHVALTTYGDDALSTVSEHCPKYNAKEMRSELGKHGVVVTDVWKSDDMKEYYPFSECDFLKRTFRFNEELQRYVGPLEKDSIFKSLCAVMRSKYISQYEIVGVNIADALREMCLHGKHEYESFREKITPIVDKYEFRHLVPNLCYTYEEMIYTFHERPEIEKDHTPVENIIPHGRVDEFEETPKENQGICCVTAHNKVEHFYQVACDDGSLRAHYLPHVRYKSKNQTKAFNRLRFDPGLMLISFTNDQEVLWYLPRGAPMPVATTAKWRVSIDNSVESHFEAIERLFGIPMVMDIIPHAQESTTQEGTVEYVGDDSHKVRVPGEIDNTRRPFPTNEYDLASIFRRPVTIQFTWDPSIVFFEVFNPWTVFFEDPFVVNRINNYNLVSCRLNVKFVMNANPFMMGQLMAVYHPLASFDNLTANASLIAADNIQMSQMPRVLLEASSSKGAELNIPFFWHKDWFSVPEAEWNDAGNIVMREINSLYHASPTPNSDDRVGITVFITAEDIQLAKPTMANCINLVPQSALTEDVCSASENIIPHAKDEFEESGVVSGPASAVAKAAGALTKVPVIGKYATAAETAATATAKLASHFGYCTPNHVETPTVIVGRAVTALAPCDTVDLGQQLAVTQKQGITIDPRTLGLDGTDAMNIASICARESYLTTDPWLLNSPMEGMLFNMVVDPCIHDVQTVGGQLTHFFPACCAAVMPFRYYRGVMVIRIQVIASKFHRGRLAIVYDPYQTPAVLNVNRARVDIMDIEETRELVVEIPICQTLPVLEHVDTDSTRDRMFGSTRIPRVYAKNGTLSVWVLNRLTAPSYEAGAPTSVDINYWVSMKDAEVFVPHIMPVQDLTLFPTPLTALRENIIPHANTDPVAPDTGQAYITSGRAMTTARDLPELNTMIAGEAILSIKSLLVRSSLHHTFVPQGANALRVRHIVPLIPFQRGYAPNAVHTTAAGDPYNYAGFTWMAYFIPCYQGYRGSVRWKFIWRPTDSSRNWDSPRVFRVNSGYADEVSTALANEPSAQNAQNLAPANNLTAMGAALQSCAINTAIEVTVPWYTQYKMEPGKVADTTSGTAVLNRSAVELSTYSYRTARDMWDVFAGAGDDFSLYFWTGMPRLYKETGAPPA